MLRFEKMAKIARRFRMPTGMSLREFDFLYAKIEKTYREEERKGLSKLLCSILGVFHHFHGGVQLGRRGVKLGSWPDHVCTLFNL